MVFKKASLGFEEKVKSTYIGAHGIDPIMKNWNFGRGRVSYARPNVSRAFVLELVCSHTGAPVGCLEKNQETKDGTSIHKRRDSVGSKRYSMQSLIAGPAE